jgi:hypothetical protein
MAENVDCPKSAGAQRVTVEIIMVSDLKYLLLRVTLVDGQNEATRQGYHRTMA